MNSRPTDNFRNLLQFLLIGIIFIAGVSLLPTPAVAEEVDFDWEIVSDGSGQPIIRADASDYADDFEILESFEWKVIPNNSSREATESLSYDPVIHLSQKKVEPGFTYILKVSFIAAQIGTSQNVAGTAKKAVALPLISSQSECVSNFSNGYARIELDIQPKLVDFAERIGNPLFEFYTVYDDGFRSFNGRDSEAPYENENRLLGTSIEAELTFTDSDIVLTKEVYTGGTYPRNCKEVTVRFSWQADDGEVSVKALSPTGEYTYRWDFNGEVSASGVEASYDFNADGPKIITLVAEGNEGSGNPDVSTSTDIFISEGSSSADTDGDGILDDADPDDDNDGTPDSEDEYPTDPTRTGKVDDGTDADSDGDGTPDGEDPCPDDASDSCDGSEEASEDGLVTCINDCNWEKFIDMINGLISWLIGIATAVATLLFMYAGFIYLTSQGSEEKVKQAKAIFSNVAVGFGIILIAYLVVITVVTLLTSDDWRSNEDIQQLIPVDLSLEEGVDEANDSNYAS